MRAVIVASEPSAIALALAEHYRTRADAEVTLLAGGLPGQRDLAGVRGDLVWCLTAGPGRRLPDQAAGRDLVLIRGLLAAVGSIRPARLCFVSPARLICSEACVVPESGYQPGAAGQDAIAREYLSLETEVIDRCRELGVQARVVRLDPVVATAADGTTTRGSPVIDILSAIASTAAEVDQRWPGYLRTRELRLVASAGAVLPALDARAAAAALAAIGDAVPYATEYVNLTAASPSTVAEVCESVGPAFGVRLVPSPPGSALNPVDRLLAARLAGAGDWLRRPAAKFARDQAMRDGSADPETFALDVPAIAALARSVRDEHADRARRYDEPDFEPVTIGNVGGAPLTYLRTGTIGTPLVLINALGQGTVFWHRLIGYLRPRRLLTWEPRGLYEDFAVAATLAEQVDDLQAVLDREGITSCHVVAWCTGPRVALELVSRRPETVASLIFLNGSFKSIGDPDGLDTAYERNLEYVCRTLKETPALAGRLMRLFGGQPAQAPDQATGSEEFGAAVLRLVSSPLRDEVRRPFSDPGVLARYAGQLLDVWSARPLADADQVRVPTLCVGAEYDDVASPERFLRATGSIGGVIQVQLPSATHYALHDQADLVAGLITDFLSAHS